MIWLTWRPYGLLAAIGLFAQGVPADAASVAGRYDAHWGGAPVGTIVVGLADTGHAFANVIDIRATGLARALTDFSARAESAGAYDSVRGPLPSHYSATYDLRRRKGKQLSIDFRPVGSAGSLAVPANAEAAARMPAALRSDVLDPLTAVLVIRRTIRAGGLASGSRFRVPIFDGKRRFDAEGTVLGFGSAVVDGKRVPMIDIAVLLRPVAIAKLERDDEDDIEREARLRFTADHNALPLRLSVDIAYVPLTIELAETCDDFAACRTP
ncbi:MAG TPA: DUF3108 domain-containing protein [Alphaproteobacteria bacterium]|nr:DUF3108 domain-containing protein [Alphaproteobacteria bacterium]